MKVTELRLGALFSPLKISLDHNEGHNDHVVLGFGSILYHFVITTTSLGRLVLAQFGGFVLFSFSGSAQNNH